MPDQKTELYSHVFPFGLNGHRSISAPIMVNLSVRISLVEEEEEEGQEEGEVRGEKGIWLGDHGSAIAWLVSQLLGIWRWPYVPSMLLWPLGR